MVRRIIEHRFGPLSQIISTDSDVSPAQALRILLSVCWKRKRWTNWSCELPQECGQ
jgi:hypothetical protein